MKPVTLVATATALLSSTAALAQAPSNRELYEIMQAQQAEIEALQANSHSGLNRTTLGGYGELHYNNLKNQDNKIDFHRFVLFVNHEFNDRIRLFTELEVEHAFAAGAEAGKDGAPGEVEVEQAYIEFDLTDALQAKGGLFLVPVGILNETHEPPTFYGVERNAVEKNIIPSTWWEAGAAINGRNENGLSWDFAIHGGLKTSAASDYKIRDGRQKVASATANDPAFTGRIRFTGIAGLDVAASLQYQSNITQDDTNEVSATLLETHAIYQAGPVKLTGLYATWNLDGAGPEAVGADQQTGYYLEASSKVCEKMGVFGRYSDWDNKAGDSTDSNTNETTVGVNYWPHENVVIKADIFDQGGVSNSQGFNLGIGYQF